MAPIIHRTAARKRKRITNTSIRLLHPTILTTIPRNTTFTISSALRLGSFPRRPHCEKNIHLGFRRAGTQGHDSHPRPLTSSPAPLLKKGRRLCGRINGLWCKRTSSSGMMDRCRDSDQSRNGSKVGASTRKSWSCVSLVFEL